LAGIAGGTAMVPPGTAIWFCFRVFSSILFSKSRITSSVAA
jgi:hypothetical protein